MPISDEYQAILKTALAPRLKACPMCQGKAWELGLDLVFLPTISPPEAQINLGMGQPCAAAICKTCGSVQLFNLFRLGIADRLGFKPSPVKQDA